MRKTNIQSFQKIFSSEKWCKTHHRNGFYTPIDCTQVLSYIELHVGRPLQYKEKNSWKQNNYLDILGWNWDKDAGALCESNGLLKLEGSEPFQIFIILTLIIQPNSYQNRICCSFDKLSFLTCTIYILRWPSFRPWPAVFSSRLNFKLHALKFHKCTCLRTYLK